LVIALLLPAIGALIWCIFPAQLNDSELIRDSLGVFTEIRLRKLKQFFHYRDAEFLTLTHE
jgi:hypothetical protein